MSDTKKDFPVEALWRGASATSKTEALKTVRKLLEYLRDEEKKNRLSDQTTQYILALAVMMFLDSSVQSLEKDLSNNLQKFEKRATELLFNLG